MPNVWIDPFLPWFVLIDGTASGPLGLSHVLVPGGLSFGFQIPASLAGQQIVLQDTVLSAAAANGSLAFSEAHVIEIQ